MQSEEKKVPPTPKALVICFTRNVTGSRPMYPPTAPKPTPFSYQSNKAALWKYTPPAFGERAATEGDSLSAKVTNITGLSSVTRSGRVFAPPHSAELPSKGKAPINSEPHRALLVKVLNEAHVAYDISVEGFEGIVNHINNNNYIAFAEEEIPVEGRGQKPPWRNFLLMRHV